MKCVALACLLLAACSTTARAVIVSAGGGANQFNLEFVPIGNPGNVADTTGSPNPSGSVAYDYLMGKYEVSRDMITKANAPVASGGGNLGITLSDMSAFGANGANRPATGVSWNEAARFVNWLNTSQGFAAAYKFATQPGDVGYVANQNVSMWTASDAGYNAANPFRNSLANYVLPSAAEWYKAAFFNPGAGTYVDFPTGSNTAPTAVASGTSPGTAVYNGQFGPADITQAGGGSFYGVVGQGGNVSEWDETYSVNAAGLGTRGIRGGNWGITSSVLASTLRGSQNPLIESSNTGFRIAIAVPETSSLLCCGVIMLGGMCWKWIAARP